MQRLLEAALPLQETDDDDPLYQAALAVEADARLAAEMEEWEEAALGDGLGNDEPREPPPR